MRFAVDAAALRAQGRSPRAESVVVCVFLTAAWTIFVGYKALSLVENLF
jgi:hypothetical protein